MTGQLSFFQQETKQFLSDIDTICKDWKEKYQGTTTPAPATALTPTGATLKDQGMAAAISHANRKEPSWSERAGELLKEFANKSDEPFTSEGFVVWIKIFDKLPDPPSNQAYGGIFAKARRKGIIKHVGYSQALNPTSHARPISRWQKV